MAKRRAGFFSRLATGIKEFFFGKSPTVKRIRKFDTSQVNTQEKFLEFANIIGEELKNQKAITVPEAPTMEQVLPGGRPDIQQPQFEEIPEFGQEQVDALTQAAERKFTTQDLPALAERFAAGGNRSVTTPQFAAAAGRAQADLRTNLAAALQEMRGRYGLERARVGTQQQNVALQGQLGAGSLDLRAGDLTLNQYLNQLKRSDLLSQMQARRANPLLALGQLGMQPRYDTALMQGRPGSIEKGIPILKSLAKIYMAGI